MIRQTFFYHRDTETQSIVRQKAKVKSKNRHKLLAFSFLGFKSLSVPLRLCGAILLLVLAIAAQVPSPKSVLGFTPTDDKVIADWGQIIDYFTKLDKASNKVTVNEIGKTTNGAPLIVAFISSPDNIKKLDKYREFYAKLFDPRRVKNDADLADLIKNGRRIV